MEGRIQGRSWFVSREWRQPKIATLKGDFGISDLGTKTIGLSEKS